MKQNNRVRKRKERDGKGKKKRRGPAEYMYFYNLKKQYQQNMWPQDVAVGYWRLLRQSVHLLIPLAV